MKSAWITQALGEVFFRPACVGENPVNFVGEWAVENAGVVGTNGEVDIGFEEGVNGVVCRVGNAADAQIGGGAGFDDGAQLSKAVEDILLTFLNVFKALGMIGAFDEVIGRFVF